MDERRRNAHRYRKVSNRSARRLAERYGGDTRAITDLDDDVVATTVAAMRKARGLRTTDRRPVKRA